MSSSSDTTSSATDIICMVTKCSSANDLRRIIRSEVEKACLIKSSLVTILHNILIGWKMTYLTSCMRNYNSESAIKHTEVVKSINTLKCDIDFVKPQEHQQ